MPLPCPLAPVRAADGRPRGLAQRLPDRARAFRTAEKRGKSDLGPIMRRLRAGIRHVEIRGSGHAMPPRGLVPYSTLPHASANVDRDNPAARRVDDPDPAMLAIAARERQEIRAELG